MRILSKAQWASERREPVQKYEDYKSTLERAIKFIPLLSRNIEVGEIDSGRRMLAAHSRAEQHLNKVIFSYSAGLLVSEISENLGECLDAWQNFVRYNLEFEISGDNDGHKIPHIDLYDSSYWTALQLVCFSILLGHISELQKIMDLLVHENDDQDALLEDLVAPYLPGRPGSTIYTRQLPYRKTRKIFQAAPDKRPALMTQYLKEWYHASRREPYHDRHKSSLFPGYWSLEAAAITFILDIDDSTYRDMPFYPKDLVDYARSVSTSPGKPIPPAPRMSSVQGGNPCPKAGWWLTPAGGSVPHYFHLGEKFPEYKGNHWGTAMWQWCDDQPPAP